MERAAGSDDYELRLSWLTHHGAFYREVQGGINRLSVANIMTEGISEKLNSFSQMGHLWIYWPRWYSISLVVRDPGHVKLIVKVIVIISCV